MKYYLAIKRNEVLIHATTWMNLRSITWRERSQTQKYTCYDSSCMKFKIVDFKERLSRQFDFVRLRCLEKVLLS